MTTVTPRTNPEGCRGGPTDTIVLRSCKRALHIMMMPACCDYCSTVPEPWVSVCWSSALDTLAMGSFKAVTRITVMHVLRCDKYLMQPWSPSFPNLIPERQQGQSFAPLPEFLRPIHLDCSRHSSLREMYWRGSVSRSGPKDHFRCIVWPLLRWRGWTINNNDLPTCGSARQTHRQKSHRSYVDIPPRPWLLGRGPIGMRRQSWVPV